MYRMYRAWVLKSRDRFPIPKPFSTVVVRWDKLIPVFLDISRFPPGANFHPTSKVAF
jgi:lysophospholipid acyltransferase (LPLAT)-like uncharacterized protein